MWTENGSYTGAATWEDHVALINNYTEDFYFGCIVTNETSFMVCINYHTISKITPKVTRSKAGYKIRYKGGSTVIFQRENAIKMLMKDHFRRAAYYRSIRRFVL